VKHDLAKQPPTRELLERLLDESRLDDFLNPRSPAYKELGLGTKKLTKKQAIELILGDPNLMRRPLVLTKGDAVFGYKPDEYERLGRR
jgi:Spx/MgsR family transcriptional regulator